MNNKFESTEPAFVWSSRPVATAAGGRERGDGE